MAIILNRGFSIGFADFQTTEIGLHAFEGEIAIVEKAITDGIDWSAEGTYPLHGALMGHRQALAIKLFHGGSPIDSETYELALNYCKELYDMLPKNPLLQKELEQSWRDHRLSWNLLQAKDSDLYIQIAELLTTGADPNKLTNVTAGVRGFYPIHLAVRSRKSDLVELLLESGAHPNALNEENKSALRMVYSNPLFRPKQRRELRRLFKKYKGEFIPRNSDFLNHLKFVFGFEIELKLLEEV